MLIKLLNWEIKATSRLFVPLYITLLVFALFNRILNPFELMASSSNLNFQTIIGFLSIAAYFALIVGVGVMTLVIMIQRFYKSLLGDEGYLMFTLPTTKWRHIISKLLIAILWTVLSILITIISVILIANPENLSGELSNMISEIRMVFGTAGLFMLPTVMVLGITQSIMMIYTAITLGHMFSRHRLLASFGMYCGLYMFNQILFVIFILVFGSGIFNFLNHTDLTQGGASIIMGGFGICIALLICLYFSVTNILLKRRLNLE